MRFYFENLLSKWGFEDGEILHDLIHKENIDVDPHDVLCAVVKELVIPKTQDKIEVYTVSTCHNPIRASSVNGQQVFSTLPNNVDFNIDFVDIEDEEIIKIAKRLCNA